MIKEVNRDHKVSIWQNKGKSFKKDITAIDVKGSTEVSEKNKKLLIGGFSGEVESEARVQGLES